MTLSIGRHDPRRMETPWGVAQGKVEQIAPGILRVSTASHGGYEITSTRRAQMHPLLGLIPTYAGGNWYEEDEDAILVVLSFPGAFEPIQVWSAVRSVQGTRAFRSDPIAHAGIQLWLASPASELARSKAATWELEHAGWWLSGSMGTAGKGWRVRFSQIGTDRIATRQMNDYPERIYETLPGVEAGS